MKVFVTGVNGQLGYDVLRALSSRGHLAIGSGRAAQECTESSMPYVQLDITHADAVHAALHSLKPDAVIHCAAWTAVDDAEKSENIRQVFDINCTGTRNIALSCQETGCKMMYLSTEYVFDGQGNAPWPPEHPVCHPLNTYGQSKLEGEKAVATLVSRHFIVRTSWVFGPNGRNFVRTMLRLARTHPILRVVMDQIGRPTYTCDLARLLVDLIESEFYGCYHASNEGDYISWYDFACEIFRLADLSTTVIPVSTSEYGLSRAIRPANSRLDTSKLLRLGFTPLPDWRDALRRFLQAYKEI